MADFTALKTAIQNAIKQNGNEEITGNILQDVLLAIVSTLGDGSINDLITALGSEAMTRSQADGTLQQNINAEAQARGNADTTLQQNIDAEAQARQLADSTLQGGINTVSAAITAINNAIGNGCVYAGIATPSSTPASGKVFYLALTAGTYTNYGGLEVSQGINILKNNGSTWSLDSFLGIDDAPTPSSNKLVKSDGVFNDIMINGSAFDLSAYNNGTTYADLNAALTALNALPAAYKKGGMSMKYVQTSDNNYVKFFCTAQNFTTDVTQWQGVDDEPTAGSNNLVKSGGIYRELNDENIISSSDYTKYENGKVVYDTGLSGSASASDNQDLYRIDIPAGEYNHLRVYMSKSISGFAAIALYSGNNETTDYLKNDSLNGDVSTGKYYDIDLPANVKRIQITNNRANVPTPSISLFKEKYVEKDLYESEIQEIEEKLDVVVDKKILTNSEYTKHENSKVLYSTGISGTASVSDNQDVYRIDIEAGKYNYLSVFMSKSISGYAAIAMYSGIHEATDYLQSESLNGNVSTGDFYNINIPYNVSRIQITNNRANVPTPIIALYKINAVSESEYNADKEKINRMVQSISNPFVGSPFCYHFQPNYFLLDADGKKVIPSQSIADIEIAARLGFKFIEANIQATSDGHFICMHGVDKKFGSDEVEHTDGVTDISNILISSVTLAWIKQNVVYKSEVAKYRTSVPSLEEFCEACKTNHIGLFAGVGGISEEAIRICIKYMDDNLILYNPPTTVREYFGGWVFTWNNEEHSIDTLMARADSYGYPYMCGVGNTQVQYLIDNNILDDFVNALHEKGYLAIMASVYDTEEQTRELFKRGFDGSGAGHEVNPFSHNSEIYDLNAASFSDCISEGASISDGVCTLPNGETISCSEQVQRCSLGKAQVSIRFNGSITLRFGSAGTRQLQSDGNELIIISDYFLQRDSGIVVTGVSSSTTISDFIYKVSQC